MLDDPDTAPVATAFGTKFLPRLDYLQEKADFVQYNLTTKRYFPEGAYPGNGAKPVLMITSGSSEARSLRGEAKQDENGWYVDVDPVVDAQDWIIGIEYEMKVELPASTYSKRTKQTALITPWLSSYTSISTSQVAIALMFDKEGYEPYSYDVDVAVADVTKANATLISGSGYQFRPYLLPWAFGICNYLALQIPTLLQSLATAGKATTTSGESAQCNETPPHRNH